jgi:hypothetical protein
MDFNNGSMESQQIVELLLSMQAKMDTNQERMETNRKAYHEDMMAMVDAYHERMMACLGKMEADTEKTEPDPGLMQSTEKHQEITKGEAAVMPVGEPRKRRRVQSLAVECCQKRKERTRGNRGSRRKSATACRKVSHCARVAWYRKSVVRKIGTQENCGSCKEFAAAGIRATRCAKVARSKGRSHEGPLVQREQRTTQTKIKFSRASQKGRTLRMRQLVRLEGTNGTRNQDFKEQLCLGNERTTSGIYRKTIGLEIIKRAVRISSRMRKVTDLTLWRGRPPPKRKRN